MSIRVPIYREARCFPEVYALTLHHPLVSSAADFVHAWTFFPFLPRNMGTSGFFVHAWTIFPFLPRNTGTSGFFVHAWTIFPLLPRNTGTSGFFVHAWTIFPFLPLSLLGEISFASQLAEFQVLSKKSDTTRKVDHIILSLHPCRARL
ncbi:MAG: hypothetical protein QM270_00280 [Bacillota bacterium]|nr:hypothetical protein [Bacillota bacterium]